MKEYAYTLKFSVRSYEADIEGIVNNAVYLHYMEFTRHEFCKLAGVSFPEMHAMGIDPVARRVEIDYKHPLLPDEEVTSCLNITREGPLFVFDQDLYNHEGLLATHAKVYIATLENGHVSRGDALAAIFQKYLK